MAADQKNFGVAHDDIRFFELRAARANGLDFPAFERDPGFEALLDEVIMEGLLVLNDTHGWRFLKVVLFYQRPEGAHFMRRKNA